MPQGPKSKCMDYEREKEKRQEAQGWSMKKEEKKKGKINKGDMEWVRLSVGEEKGGEKNRGKTKEKEKDLQIEVCSF